MNIPTTLRVAASKASKPLNGSAGSHVFHCDDGQEWAVKFYDGKKTVVNEYLGVKLAQGLGLPALQNAFVMISEAVIDSVDSLKARKNIEGGIHHGTLYDPTAFNLQGKPAPSTSSIVNASALPGVFLYYNLIQNNDCGDQNHLFTQSGTNVKYTMVDMGNTLGVEWNAQSLQTNISTAGLMAMHPVFLASVTGLSCLEPYLKNVEGLTRTDLLQITEGIPSEWSISDMEKDAWITFILARAPLMRSMIVSNKAIFPNWKP
jgi:hypothetical protein